MQFKPQRLGKSMEYLQGRIGDPAFQLRNVGPVDCRHQGQPFLGQVGFLPRGLDLLRQVLAQLIESLVFHAGQDGGAETFNPRNIIDNIFQMFIIWTLGMCRPYWPAPALFGGFPDLLRYGPAALVGCADWVGRSCRMEKGSWSFRGGTGFLFTGISIYSRGQDHGNL